MEDKINFIELVNFFSIQGWIALGKIANSTTGKLEKDLNTAKFIISVLEVIEEKTKGNLNEEEESVLNQSLTSLRLTYVSEVNKPKQ